MGEILYPVHDTLICWQLALSLGSVDVDLQGNIFAVSLTKSTNRLLGVLTSTKLTDLGRLLT